MGQYHVLINMDKLEYVNPHEVGSGLKMWEIMYSGTLPKMLVALLAASCKGGARGGGDIDSPLAGRWAGDRVAFIGDYAEPTDVPDGFHEAYNFISAGEYSEAELQNWYGDDPELLAKMKTARTDWLNISPLCREFLAGEDNGVFYGDGWMDYAELDKYDTDGAPGRADSRNTLAVLQSQVASMKFPAGSDEKTRIAFHRLYHKVLDDLNWMQRLLSDDPWIADRMGGQRESVDTEDRYPWDRGLILINVIKWVDSQDADYSELLIQYFREVLAGTRSEAIKEIALLRGIITSVD